MQEKDLSNKQELWTRGMDKSFEWELPTKVVNKNCDKKLWTKFVNMSSDEKLWTMVNNCYEKRIVSKGFEQELWSRLLRAEFVRKSVEQKLWTRVVNKSYKQKLRTKDVVATLTTFLTIFYQQKNII